MATERNKRNKTGFFASHLRCSLLHFAKLGLELAHCVGALPSICPRMNTQPTKKVAGRCFLWSPLSLSLEPRGSVIVGSHAIFGQVISVLEICWRREDADELMLRPQDLRKRERERERQVREVSYKTTGSTCGPLSSLRQHSLGDGIAVRFSGPMGGKPPPP